MQFHPGLHVLVFSPLFFPLHFSFIPFFFSFFPLTFFTSCLASFPPNFFLLFVSLIPFFLLTVPLTFFLLVKLLARPFVLY